MRPNKSLLRIMLCSVCTVMILTIAACGGESTEKAAKTIPVTNVVAAEVRTQDVANSKEFVGQLNAQKTVEVRSRVDGYLLERTFKEGSMVQKGDVLYKVDPNQYQEALKEAQATLRRDRAAYEQARKEYDRFKALVDQGAVSREEYDTRKSTMDQAKATVESDEAAVQKAQLDVGYTSIKAPMGGLIGKTQVNIGSLVSSASTLMTTISLVDPIYFDFSVSEALYLERMKQRQENGTTSRALQLILSDGSVYPYNGTFDMTDPTVDPETATLGVRISYPNPDKILLPGQYAKLSTTTNVVKGATVVPTRALRDTQGLISVMTVVNGTAQGKTITIGERRDDITIVKDGLEPGDIVIVDGGAKLRNNAPVNATIKTFEEILK